MTPAQLRAFVCVVRHGSVKSAASDLGLSESAVSMHMAQLRKELGDPLFSRSASGISFTPGGLRLASRAVELLGLQDLTMLEVGQAARGRRILRLAISNTFAEYAADGLVEEFTTRTPDLDVEVSVQPTDDFTDLLTSRAVDLAIGPASRIPPNLIQRQFLAYDLNVVCAPAHEFARARPTVQQLRQASWFLGPSATNQVEACAALLARLGVPATNQRIFHSEAGAIEATRHADALAVAIAHTTTGDLNAGRLVKVAGPDATAKGAWTATALVDEADSASYELLRFLTTPRAIQAMLRGSGVPIKKLRATTHVTLWK